MNFYTIQLTKTIVVTVEHESEEDALAVALVDPTEGFDGAWDRAEAQATVIETTPSDD